MNPAPLRAERDSEEPAVAAGSSGGSGGGRTVEERLSALETRMEYLATKEDIQKLKTWVLGGVVAAMVLGLTAAFAAARLSLS